ncbi:MAG TPA: aminotransferase class III-fold pyridoxal phosphate-dependent enzyme [Anaerolineae bacterium]
MSMLLAGGASTQSRGRRPLPMGAVRGVTLAARGVREVVRFDYGDGHHERCELLSWIGGQAGLLFGASPDLLQLPFDALHLRETHGSYGHAAEYDLANALGAVFDGYLTSSDMACRFFQSGGEACAAAVRVARAATGWDEIATEGYHGAGLEFVHLPAVLGSASPMTLPIQRLFKFGDVVSMSSSANGAACIMVEIPAWDDENAIVSFLQACRTEADRQGIPLIIDDVVCGFRLALAGSCERYGVRADMIVLGKAMSATGCVSAVIGRADLVNRLSEDVFYSTTFGGSPGPCSVAAATVRWLLNHHAEVYGAAGHLQTIGRALKDGLNERGVKCVGQPERSTVVFDTDEQWLAWCRKMIEQGVMIHRPQFPTMAHTLADVEQTLRAVEAIR